METYGNKGLATEDSVDGTMFDAESFFDAAIMLKNDRIQHINHVAVMLFGYESDELKGKHVSIIVPEIIEIMRNTEGPKLESEAFAGEGRKSNASHGIRKDGSKFPVKFTISSWVDKKKTNSIIIIRDISKLKTVGEEIQAKNKFFNDVFESIISPFYVINVNDYSIEYANKTARGNNFRAGIKCYELIHNRTTPCDEGVKTCPINMIKETNGPAVINRAHTDKNGCEKIFEVHAQPLFDFNGSLKQVTKYSFDITDRIKTESELQKWADIVKMNPSPVIQFDTEGKVLLLNPAGMDFFRLSSDEDVCLNKLFPDININTFTENIVAGSSSSFEHSVAHRDFQFMIKGVPEYGIGLIYSLDITKRKKAEIELKKLEKAVLNAMMSVVITDADGIIEFANPCFTKITGYSVEEVIGKNPKFLKSGKHSRKYYKKLWNNLKSGNTWEGNFYNKKKNGEYYWQFSHIAPIMNDKGEITHFVDVSEDITEKKNARDELIKLNQRLQKSELEVLREARTLAKTNEKLFESEIKLKQINDSKDKFFSIIAHDLRGPFSGFIGLSELMEKEYNNLDSEAIARISKSMSKSAKQLFNLLENLLEWSKAQMGRMEFNPVTIDIYDFASRLSGLYMETALQKDIDLIVDLDRDTFIAADSYMLNTILRNLVSNALKFTPIGGKVVLTAANHNNNRIRISVADNGVGMDEEAMEKIFRMDAKYSTAGTENERGTGLGLLLCMELIELNGGKIWVDSEVGKGSEFHFTLPKASELRGD